jgi:FKBP-type peptidyl-prolyl cis-trans isomerase
MIVVTCVLILGAWFSVSQAQSQETQNLKTQKDKASYAIGVDVARTFKRLGVDFDLEIMIRALRDVYSEKKLSMTEEELHTTMSAHIANLREKQATAIKKAAEENKKEGEAFLAENKTKEGVITLPSGLQYKVLKTGDGKKPADTDMVEVNYRGTLINGTEFDSSYKRGQPAQFKVSAVVAGWREALKLMPVGSKWQLFIPSKIAYGERGAGSNIGPNQTLIFEVELLAIK